MVEATCSSMDGLEKRGTAARFIYSWRGEILQAGPSPASTSSSKTSLFSSG